MRDTINEEIERLKAQGDEQVVETVRYVISDLTIEQVREVADLLTKILAQD